MGFRISRTNKDGPKSGRECQKIQEIRMGNIGEQEELIAEPTTLENDSKQLNWTTKMKIDTVTMNKEERAKGRGFMKRGKERWDQKYPEYQQASWQKS